MSKKVITPVGSSLFTNYQKFPDTRNINNDYETLQTSDEREFTTPLEKRWERYIEERQDLYEIILPWVKSHLEQNASAEITSILNILDEKQEDLNVYLLASETLVSRLAAEILTEALHGYMNQAGNSVAIHFEPRADVIIGLQIWDNDTFQTIGMPGLIERIENIAEEKHQELVLNITGGFKATIPYLTLFGQIHQIPQYYTFENTKTLIRIPTLPIQFDWSFAEQFYPYFSRKNFADNEASINNELLRCHFIRKDKHGMYHPTAIRDIYQKFVEQNLPVAGTVLGHFVEYKILEYYYNNPYSGEYSRVRRSVRDLLPDGRELDLVLIKDGKDMSDYIVIEVKSFLPFFIPKKFKRLKGQIEKQLTGFQTMTMPPREYHLCVYVFPFHQKELIRDKFIEIKELVHAKLPNCRFKMLYLSVELSSEEQLQTESNYKNIYQKFVDRPIDENMLIEYPL